MPHVLLYKTGNAHMIRGVECEFKRVHAREIQFYLDRGYVSDPKDLQDAKTEYTEEYLSSLHYKKVDGIAKKLGVSTDGDKQETIRLIMEAQ